MSNIDKLLTLKEAAEILRVHVATLRRLDKTGKLKAVRVGSRRGLGDRRYRMEDIENYLKNKGQTKK